MWLSVFGRQLQKIKNVSELLYNAYILFCVCVCVSACVSEREIVHLESVHMCESIHVCVWECAYACVRRHMCMKVCTFPPLLWHCGPTWAMASSFLRCLDHTQRRITVGRTPLDEWSARRRDLYLTTHNTHNRQTSMPPVGFEPTISAGEQP